jgi:rubrerythrin
MDQLLRRVRSLFTDSGTDGTEDSSTSEREETPERDQSAGKNDDADEIGETGRTGETDGTGGTGRYVYECPGCGEVYLNEEPHRCSNCGETTAPVASND